jgi:hypothetical protein
VIQPGHVHCTTCGLCGFLLYTFLSLPRKLRFLEFFPAGWQFVLTAVAIRAVHATGNALVITTTFTYAAIEFQHSVGKIFVSSLDPLVL